MLFWSSKPCVYAHSFIFSLSFDSHLVLWLVPMCDSVSNNRISIVYIFLESHSPTCHPFIYEIVWSRKWCLHWLTRSERQRNGKKAIIHWPCCGNSLCFFWCSLRFFLLLCFTCAFSFTFPTLNWFFLQFNDAFNSVFFPSFGLKNVTLIYSALGIGLRRYSKESEMARRRWERKQMRKVTYIYLRNIFMRSTPNAQHTILTSIIEELSEQRMWALNQITQFAERKKAAPTTTTTVIIILSVKCVENILKSLKTMINSARGITQLKMFAWFVCLSLCLRCDSNWNMKL